MGLLALALTAFVLFTFLNSNPALSQPHSPHSQPDPVDEEHSQLALPEGKAADNCSDFPWDSVRLPESIKPSLYVIQIQPNLTTFRFEGTVEITAQVSKATNLIVLHESELDVELEGNGVEVVGETGRVGASQPLHCTARQQIAFRLDSPLAKGVTIKMKLKFQGNISSQFAGLYRTAYVTKGGDIQYSAVTQFEPTDARKMIPCLDEPAMKAAFEVSIVREKNMVALANMNLVRSENLPGDLVRDQFARTVKMSTYLLALSVLRDFKSISGVAQGKSNITVSVWVPSELIGDAQFALDTGIKALEYLETFFKVPFPLPKMDLLAVSDFSAGAMENWGLVTFRDYLLLYNPQVTTSTSKEYFAQVIVHELAHQWFGNLVTMKWWSDLWLNEGFASWVEYFGTTKIQPTWKLMDSFYMDNVAKALYLDGMATSHPVSVPVEDPAEIGAIFDAISYQKGASIVSMVMELGGEKTLQEGLQEYLQHFQFRNAEGEDLWKILGKHISGSLQGQRLEDVAKSWTTQVGYPLLRVGLSNSGKTVTFNQSRFLYLESKRGSESDLWPIPISYRSSSKKGRFWLTQSSNSLELENKTKWLKANLEGLGPFRVLYSTEIYKEFKKELNSNPETFSAADRASILYDAFSFLKSGHLEIETVFGLLEYVKDGKETERGPLEIVFGQLTNIKQMLYETDFYPLIQDYIRSLGEAVYKAEKWDLSSDHRERLAQITILAAACGAEVEDCVSHAQTLFDQWISDPNSLNVDLKPLVIQTGMKLGNRSVWDEVFQRFKNSRQPSEKNMLLKALGKSKDPWTIERYLRLSLDEHVVKTNEMSRVVQTAAVNNAGLPSAWRHLRRHFPELQKSLGLSSMLGRIIKSVLQQFHTTFDLQEAKEFFTGKDLGLAQKRLDETCEGIEVRIQWKKHNLNALEYWLKSRAEA